MNFFFCSISTIYTDPKSVIGHIDNSILQEFNKSEIFLKKILQDMLIYKLFLAYFDTKFILLVYIELIKYE